MKTDTQKHALELLLKCHTGNMQLTLKDWQWMADKAKDLEYYGREGALLKIAGLWESYLKHDFRTYGEMVAWVKREAEL